MDDANCEIEALSSIWAEVKIEKSDHEIVIFHKMKSMENEETSASVRIVCRIPEGYPNIDPLVQLSHPRGISEHDFSDLVQNIQACLVDNRGMPMICTLFQECCDFLTQRAHSAELDCSICLRLLSADPIIVTSCDHFMHFRCFAKYLIVTRDSIRKTIEEEQVHLKDNVDKTVYCPVCREQLSDGDNYEEEISNLLTDCEAHQKVLHAKTEESKAIDDVNQELKRWRKEQSRLQKIFEKQKKRGGIIDIEEDRKNRQFFIDTSGRGDE